VVTSAAVDIWEAELAGRTISSIITSFQSIHRARRAEMTRPFLRHVLSRSMEGEFASASSSVAGSPSSDPLDTAAGSFSVLGARFLLVTGITRRVPPAGAVSSTADSAADLRLRPCLGAAAVPGVVEDPSTVV
jgi:hypothetical protein